MQAHVTKDARYYQCERYYFRYRSEAVRPKGWQQSRHGDATVAQNWADIKTGEAGPEQ